MPSNLYHRFVEWNYRGSFLQVAVVSAMLWSLVMAVLIALQHGIVVGVWMFVISWPAMTLFGYFLGPMRHRRHERKPSD